MELPIVEPAPVVTEHAADFRDLFENQRQFRHYEPWAGNGQFSPAGC
jgi:hypothetical protein